MLDKLIFQIKRYSTRKLCPEDRSQKNKFRQIYAKIVLAEFGKERKKR